MKKAFTLLEVVMVIAVVSVLAAVVYGSYLSLTDPNYEPYVMPEERVANEMKRANDLKELELQILRAKLSAEKNQ